MSIRVRSATLLGIDAQGVNVETHILGSLKRFTIVGLPDSVVREAKYRVRCAIENSGFSFPHGEVVVSLAPAGLPKSGAGFDLAVAISILAAGGHVNPHGFASTLFLGELALDGYIKPVRGALAAACYVKKQGLHRIVLSPANAEQARYVSVSNIVPARCLREVVDVLNEVHPARSLEGGGEELDETGDEDFSDVRGQEGAKRAMEILAAGGHNMLMLGPPGSGKSMLAKRALSIFPPLSLDEKLEIARIYTAVPTNTALQSRVQRPFRSPHHTSSTAGLVGGGTPPMPGEITLAHKGMLFLDEFPELRREVIESLREPLETKHFTLCRAKHRVSYPADFIFLAAMNPCPCGMYVPTSAPIAHACECSPLAIQRYRAKVSGPILDRIDLQLNVSAVPIRELNAVPGPDPTPMMKGRVMNARMRQSKRFDSTLRLNAHMSTHETKEHCVLDTTSIGLLEEAAEKMNLSARAFTRVLKVSRTIADLESEDAISETHVAEALGYRMTI